MKINKNILMEYLYLTIFVITLFVLKELIEYVFFTRKRNNVIEKFSDTCGIIEWYYSNYNNILEIFKIFEGLTDSGSTTLGNAKMKVDDHVEFKTIDTNTVGSRIVLQPKNQAIYFEKFDDTHTNGLCYCIIFRTHQEDYGITPAQTTKKVLDFVKYEYENNQVKDTNDFKQFAGYDKVKYDTTSTPSAVTVRGTVFARFDTRGEYPNMNINVALNELIGDH